MSEYEIKDDDIQRAAESALIPRPARVEAVKSLLSDANRMIWDAREILRSIDPETGTKIEFLGNILGPLNSKVSNDERERMLSIDKRMRKDES